MPPRTQFTLDQIVEAAFEVAKSDGISGITARKVAERLGSSVAPIYVNFKEIADLKRAVVGKVFQMAKEMLKERYTDDRFLDIGIASIRFAREYDVLFRELMLTPNEYMDDYQQSLGDDVIQEMGEDPNLHGFTHEELMTILLKVRIFQLGLSVMVANRLLPPELGDEAEIELLASIGDDIVTAAQVKKEHQNG